MVEYMLTTIDNPYSPFEDFDRWMAYDHQLGHYTSELLARVTVTSEELSEADQLEAVHSAMDEIVTEDPSMVYIKVKRGDKPLALPMVEVS